MVGVISQSRVVGLIGDLIPLSAQIIHARFALIGQAWVPIWIFEEILLVIGSWDKLTLKLDFR